VLKGLLLGAAIALSASSAQAMKLDRHYTGHWELTGTINEGDGQLSNWLSQMPMGTTYILDSDGGHMSDAFQIGIALWQRNAKVIVNTQCMSACFVLFIMAPSKVIINGAQIGVHRPYTKEGDIPPEFETTYRQFLTQAHVPQRIIDKTFGTPSNDIYVVTNTELRGLNNIKFMLYLPDYAEPAKRMPKSQSAVGKSKAKKP